MQLPNSIRAALAAAIVLASLSLLPSASRATMPTADGTVPETVSNAFRAGMFSLPERPEGIHAAAAQTVWKIPIMLISFLDDTPTYGASTLDRALFDTTHATPTGSVFDYYRWASNGRITVIGKVVGHIRLNETKHYYGWTSWGLSLTATPNNDYGAISDALHHMPDIRWSDYDMDHDGYVDMLWVIHPGVGGEATSNRDNMWSITSRMSTAWRNGSTYITNDPVPGSTTAKMQIDRFTMLPELSAIHAGARAEIGTYCHEFGHALGLPDLYDTWAGTRPA